MGPFKTKNDTGGNMNCNICNAPASYLIPKKIGDDNTILRYEARCEKHKDPKLQPKKRVYMKTKYTGTVTTTHNTGKKIVQGVKRSDDMPVLQNPMWH